MRARVVIGVIVGAVLTAGAVAGGGASAAPPPLPVSVTVGPDGVCVTISLQTTHCVPLSSVSVRSAQQLPIGLPYIKGNEVCYDPTPTSKGPCVPLPETSASPQLPLVTITHNDGGTQVGTGVPGQPLAGASVDSRGVCFGFSYEVGSCLPVRFG